MGLTGRLEHTHSAWERVSEPPYVSLLTRRFTTRFTLESHETSSWSCASRLMRSQHPRKVAAVIHRLFFIPLWIGAPLMYLGLFGIGVAIMRGDWLAFGLSLVAGVAIGLYIRAYFTTRVLEHDSGRIVIETYRKRARPASEL